MHLHVNAHPSLLQFVTYTQFVYPIPPSYCMSRTFSVFSCTRTRTLLLSVPSLPPTACHVNVLCSVVHVPVRYCYLFHPSLLLHVTYIFCVQLYTYPNATVVCPIPPSYCMSRKCCVFSSTRTRTLLLSVPSLPPTYSFFAELYRNLFASLC